jgi:alkyl hydroperoxide reductase subunit AhpF
MAILSPADTARVREMLAGATNPVRLVFFTQTFNCDTCEPTGQILKELVALGDTLAIEEHNFLLERDEAAKYGIDRVPAIAVLGAEDHAIRFFGIPSGYEFMSLLDAILIVSKGDSGLTEESRAMLAGLEAPVTLKVFVTPT